MKITSINILKEEETKMFYGKVIVSLKAIGCKNLQTLNFHYLQTTASEGFRPIRDKSYKINDQIFPRGYTPTQVHYN